MDLLEKIVLTKTKMSNIKYDFNVYQSASDLKSTDYQIKTVTWNEQQDDVILTPVIVGMYD